jgi:hypothetical protein
MTRSRRLRSAAISFDFGDGRVRRNKIIDTRLSTVLFALMGQAVGEPTSLATRNLLRRSAAGPLRRRAVGRGSRRHRRLLWPHPRRRSVLGAEDDRCVRLHGQRRTPRAVVVSVGAVR